MKSLDKMTTEELRAELDRRTREQLIKAIEEIPRRVSNIVTDVSRSVLAKFVGVKIDSWGHFEIDLYQHRENPAVQAVHAALAEHARAEFVKIIGETPLVLTKKQVAEARRGYAEELSSTLSEMLDKKAKEKVQEEADRLLGEVLS